MKSKRLSSYYPVFLNVSGKKCVVIGGGQVALRKVKGLLECGAGVIVISPELSPGLNDLAGVRKIEVLREPYRAGALKGAFLVVAATGDKATNRVVAAEARRFSIPVNVVDDAENSDFIAPSCLRRGDITIAVSTAGASPALARKIRARLEKEFGGEYAALADLVAEVRAGLKKQGIKVDSEDWQQALDLDLMLDLLKKGEKSKARSLLQNRLKALKK
jgi:precorrin-2 dehydrogenase/sirohydrochlorin ferrochelatase